MTSENLSLLANVPIFSALDDKALGILEAEAQLVSIAPGDYFFRQWDPGRMMYVLKTGHCRVHVSWASREVQLARIGPGDCFGEIALIDAAPRSASIQADTFCTAIGISNQNLEKLKRLYLDQYVIVLENIAREMCKRLRSADVNRMMTAEKKPGSVDIELPWP
jgi:CRP-like cAMP-binding protein